jgi:ElaB/YqjD/DUF883 family membrane-anchored ribosome-binding protein
MGDRVSETQDKADELSTATGEQLQSAAAALRERAPEAGLLGATASALADRLEGAGLYLQEENLAAIAEDLAALIRRYPIQSLLAGATVGFLLGRMRK